VQQFLDSQTSRLDSLVPGDPGRAAVKLVANLIQCEVLVVNFDTSSCCSAACSSSA
jgi:hypothetical protein